MTTPLILSISCQLSANLRLRLRTALTKAPLLAAFTAFFARLDFPSGKPFSATRRQALWGGPAYMLAAAALLCLGANSARAQSTLTVDTLADSADSPNDCATGAGSACSLRDAINQANADNDGDFVQFQSGLTGIISLTGNLPVITTGVTIWGPGANVLTVSGNNAYSIFEVMGNVSVGIDRLSVTNGVGYSNGGSSYGGAIYWGGPFGQLSVSQCSFSGNTATNGGAIYTASGGLTESDSTFIGNSATNGGAIYITDTNASVATGIESSTFSANTATNGGAIYINLGTVKAASDTFAGNSASNGGAIYNLSTLTASNDIFAGNPASTAGAGIYNSAGVTAASYNVYYNNLAGAAEDDCNNCSSNTNFTSANANPIAVPLGNYGGPTETFLLLPGSAAICAGGGSVGGGEQRGFAADSLCSGGSVDAGAVQTNQYVVNTLIDSSDGSCTSATCSLRDALSAAGTTPGDVTFSSSLSLPGSINLGSGGPGGTGSSLFAAGQVNVLGPGAGQLTVSGDNDTGVGSVLTVNSGAQMFLYGVTVSGGYTIVSPGGGIDNQGTLSVLNSAVSGNETGNGSSGGGVYNSGTLTLTSSNVSGNSVVFGAGSGGGIFNAGTLTLTESTVAGNSVPFQGSGGGGIFNSSGSATLTGSTVSGNTAQQFCPVPNVCMGGNGGGILNSGTVIMSNSILAGNTNGTSETDGAGSFDATSSYNLIGDGTGMSGITNGANGNMVGTSGTPILPMLSGMQSNGIGSNLSTMIPLPGSPAICAGSLAIVPSGTVTDERGYPLAPSGGYCPSGLIDMGAVQTNYTGAAFVQQPTNTYLGSAISPDPTVAVYETDTLLSSNNTDAVNGVPVTLAYSDSANITGTLTETTSGGVADFSGLTPTAGETAVNLSYSIPVYGSISFAAASSTFEVIGPVSRFIVSAPSFTAAGTSFQFTITAADAAGNPNPSYNGTVQFSTSDTAAGVILPANTTLTNGVGTFSATLITEGFQSITATDTVTSSITGTTNISVNAAAAVGMEAIGYPTTWYAGATAQVAVAVVDQYGNPVESFTGPATVTTTDSAATVKQFTAFSNGVASYSVTFNTQGSQSITVSSGSIPSGTETGIQIGPMPSFVVTVATDTTDGQDTTADCTDQSQPGATPDASCSLRDAIWEAAFLGAGNVTFSPTVFSTPTTITLTAPQNSGNDFGSMPLGSNVTITGPTQGTGPSPTNLVTVSGAVPASPATGSAIFFAYGISYAGNLFGPDTIANLNIANGNGTEASGDNSGTGGISTQAQLTLTNCNFTGNMGDFAGAIYNYSGNLIINGGSFSGNSSTGVFGPDSGAIFSDTATGTPKFITTRPFAAGKTLAPGASAQVSNSATGTQQGYFGASLGGRSGFASRIRPMGGNRAGKMSYALASPLNALKLSSSPHLSAPVSPEGPPIPPYSGPSATVTNTTFSNNSGLFCGAFFDLSDVLTISGATFTNNAASFGAGALIVDEGGNAGVSATTFSNNTGPYAGGALVVDAAILQIENSTLSGNTSTGVSSSPVIDGGGLSVFQGGLVLLGYDTLYNNSSTSTVGAGAIADFASAGGFVAGFNLTVTGNSGFYGAIVDDTASENDIENTIATGNSSTDPTYLTDGISPDATGINPIVGDVFTSPGINLSPLGNYGGTTQTSIPLPGSTAICSGSVAGQSDAASNWGLILTTDQRGGSNVNTTYPGTGGSCVDAGSVQTNYAISFTTQPPASVSKGQTISPAPVVILTESGTLFSASAGSMAMSDSAHLLSGTLVEPVSSGTATFDNLTIPSFTNNDILTAKLPLSSSINLTAHAANSITVPRTAQTITFNNPGTQSIGTPLALLATSDSGLTVSFYSLTNSRCTVSGTTATFVASGTCVIVAQQPGNSNFAPALQIQQSFTINQEAQTITFNNPGTQTAGTPLTLSASADSGLTVAFSSVTGSRCTVSGSTATFISSGICTIVAEQRGNSAFLAAANVSQSFTVNKASQTINFANPGVQAVGAPLTLSATADSGLAVTYASLTGSRCTVSGNTATFITAGTCTITAMQAGNGAYFAATSVTQSFTVNKESQTINFANPGAQTIGTPFTLSASASSSLPVTFSSITSSRCTVSGNTATFIAAGTCVIVAGQTGNNAYAAAPGASQSFTVNKEPQTITFANPGTQTVGTPLTLSATATSSLNVTFSSITGSRCTVSGNTATFIKAGTCVIVAQQSGNSIYAAAPEVSQSFTLNSN